VHGTKNLRVVDASVMPIISRGNPQTTVYAVAERAADLVKQEYSICQLGQQAHARVVEPL